MIGHKNPCKNIKNNPFLRKESQSTPSMTPKKLTVPFSEQGSKGNRADIDEANEGK